jgi:hypothetical protein
LLVITDRQVFWLSVVLPILPNLAISGFYGFVSITAAGAAGIHTPSLAPVGLVRHDSSGTARLACFILRSWMAPVVFKDASLRRWRAENFITLSHQKIKTGVVYPSHYYFVAL